MTKLGIFVLRLLAAAIGGLCVYASYEPLGWFWSGLVGVSLLVASLMPFRNQEVRFWPGVLIGFTHGLALYLLLLPWIGEFVGAMPFVALAVTMACYTAVLGGFGAKLLSHRGGLWLFPFIYVAAEHVRSNFPFGGFAWVRLAWGQINGPLAQLAPWGGPALVTFSAVLIAVAAVYLVRNRAIIGGFVIVAIFAASGAAWLTNGSEDTAHVNVAAIQGNVPRMGLDFNAQRRAVLENHVRETEKLGPNSDLDFIIWPENSSDVNPFADNQAAQLINQALKATNLPILVGTITVDEVGPKNTMVVMDPETGRGEQHNKIFLQPFGEYMPMRDFFRLFTPLVDEAGNFTPGTGQGVVDINAKSLGRMIKLGIATCYEVAFDKAGRQAVLAGAEIMTTPTNNATFGFTDMTYQQLAMSRMRALELDRAVVVAATSGVSALIEPTGKVIEETSIFEAATLHNSLPLRDSVTFAARYGLFVELGLVIIGGLVALWALFSRPKKATS